MPDATQICHTIKAKPNRFAVSQEQDSRTEPEQPAKAGDVVPLSRLLEQSDKQAQSAQQAPVPATTPVREIGGRSDGLDPTRYGDWEKNGRCIDF
ncbi:MAG: DUF1674 domain-containing protein [Nevskiales bacterium]|nr:DUF1674 domain-containing protein [Nevskiales bacterium]